MADPDLIAGLHKQAADALEILAGPNPTDALSAAKSLTAQLRDYRQYDLMIRLAEAVSRVDPGDPTTRRLYAQALIETGKASVAVDVLQSLTRRLPKDHPESFEAMGLLGRAYKQIFVDSGDKTSDGARDAIRQAIASYRKPFENNPTMTWHGVNLLALVANSRRFGVTPPSTLKAAAIAGGLLQTLGGIPESQRDGWYLLTLAETYAGLNRWDDVEATLKTYVQQPDPKAFPLASALRQFTQIWDFEHTDRGRGLISILCAGLMKLPGATLNIAIDDLQRARGAQPSQGQLEAILGVHGAKTYQWWKTGLTRALSVASIRQKLGDRVGTGFLVRAASIGIEGGDEPVVLTNFHVVNEQGQIPGIRPDQAEVVFEAVDSATAYSIDKILWSSPPEQCDASVLRLTTPVTSVTPLAVARSLPPLGQDEQVYVVGYPGGGNLAFSFQDNELLDHEGPPAGHPQIPNVCRVHYHAPTEGGSSGSPVFNSDSWEVIALHHRGGKTGMPRLNGAAGTYAANEGIAIQSIAAFPKS